MRVRLHSRGQALVELALVSTILVLLLASAFDLGRLFYTTITISGAARAGALQAAVTPNSYKSQDCAANAWDASNAIVCAVQDETASSLVHITYKQITVTCQDFAGDAVAPCPSAPASNVRSNVTVTASMPLLTPVLQAILGSSVPVSSSALSDQKALPPPVTQ